MTVSRRALFVGLGAFCLTRPAAATGPIDDLLARIARARAPLRTLRGSFTQTRTIGLLSTDVRSVGRLTLVRPDRLRWELAPPDDVTFWIGPEGLAYRNAHGHGRMPASSAKIAAALQDLRALLGGDLAILAERWTLSALRDDASGAEIEARSRAVAGPPGSGSVAPGARTMRFALAPDLIRPTRMLLIEGERDRTAIDFGEMTINPPIDDSAMRPPA